MNSPYSLVAGLVLLATSAGWSQLAEPSGSSGYKLLKLDISPRQAALSGAGTALPESDPDASPAIATPQGTRLSAGWTSGYAQLDGQIEHASWQVPALGGAVFGRLRFQGFEEIDGYDTESRPTGTYTASTWGAGLGFSRSLGMFAPEWTAGLALHGGMNRVETATSWAGWTDAGIRWNRGAFGAGASVRNWGAASTSGDDPETLPFQTSLGGSWTRALPADWTLSVLADARWTIDEEWTLPLGLEARWGLLSLRSGMQLGLEEARPSFGVGVQGASWGVDASLAWHGALGLSPGMALSAGI